MGYQENAFFFHHENICCGYSTGIDALLMNTHNVCFCGVIRKILVAKSALSGAMKYTSEKIHMMVQCVLMLPDSLYTLHLLITNINTPDSHYPKL